MKKRNPSTLPIPSFSGPRESTGAAGQTIQRRELLKRGLGLGMTVLFVGAGAGAQSLGGVGAGERKSLCGDYDSQGQMTADTLCGTTQNGLNTEEDSSCGLPNQKGDPSGFVTEDYDCTSGQPDSSCGMLAGPGADGSGSHWADLGCGVQDGADSDCGLTDWKGQEFRDNAQA